MNTPEQIAAAEAAAQRVIDANDLEQEDGENPLAALGWAMGGQLGYEDALIRFAAAAVEADRASHDLRYASQIIRRHSARAVIWGRGDAEGVLDDMIEGGVIEEPASDEYDKIIDRAMTTYSWDSLSDCTEGGWGAIREAIREAL